MVCGIYKIQNITNNKIYIGSSKNIKQRWQKHKALLRHKHHPNSHLLSAWKKYGEENFSFSIIEECDEKNLITREQYYIDTLKPEYNETLIAGKVEMTNERRKKLSKSLKKLYSKNEFPKTTKTVYQYDLKGNYITSYSSLTEASRITHTNLPHLSSALHGKIDIAGGYVWRFYKTTKLNVWFNRMGRPITKEPYKPQHFRIVVEGNNTIMYFKNASEICKKFNCTVHQVYSAIRRKSKLLKKYYVKRELIEL